MASFADPTDNLHSHCTCARMLLNKMSALPGSSWFSSNSRWVLNYFHELFLVKSAVLSGSDFPLESHLLPTQCSCIMVCTVCLNVPLHTYIENEVKGFPYVVLQVILFLHSMWSLDSFHSVIPPFCVSSRIKSVHALALEYIVAFYPICLILVSYGCM